MGISLLSRLECERKEVLILEGNCWEQHLVIVTTEHSCACSLPSSSSTWRAHWLLACRILPANISMWFLYCAAYGPNYTFLSHLCDPVKSHPWCAAFRRALAQFWASPRPEAPWKRKKTEMQFIYWCGVLRHLHSCGSEARDPFLPELSTRCWGGFWGGSICGVYKYKIITESMCTFS